MACCAQVGPIMPPLQSHSSWNLDRGCCAHVSACLALVHMGLSDPGERVRPPGAEHGALLHAVSPTGWRGAARTRAHTPARPWLLVGPHPAQRRIQEHCAIAQAEVLPQAAWKGLACAQQLPGIEWGNQVLAWLWHVEQLLGISQVSLSKVPVACPLLSPAWPHPDCSFALFPGRGGQNGGTPAGASYFPTW
ncbi:major histocompatibility complex class I-related-like [Platysternon megacephalum]|uniref:Major histocompatibility complex class I-related-like n=1 Tax=Platysternon megacephalum TaxID=55544 RepID=A0A4D9DRZ9_9SAUR|nr:major histocompatibility complex class I-related-like [Platysternon megacephalum]